VWDLGCDSGSILDRADLFGTQVPEQIAADKSYDRKDQGDRVLQISVLGQGRSDEWTGRRNGYNEARVEADETRHVSDDQVVV
jgi:hypothetical protein